MFFIILYYNKFCMDFSVDFLRVVSLIIVFLLSTTRLMSVMKLKRFGLQPASNVLIGR